MCWLTHVCGEPDMSVSVISVTTSLPAREPNRILRKFISNKTAVMGAVLVLFFALLALLAPWISPFDPIKADFMAVRKAPSLLHWLGTDELGRDILSRLFWGARTSLMAGCVSVVIAIVIGVPLGLVAGYWQGWLDNIISRVVEALLSCPFLVLAIALGAFLGPSLGNAMIAIGLSAMPMFARLTGGSCSNMCCPMCSRRFWCRRRWRLRRQLLPKPACRSLASVSNLRILPGAPC